MYSHAMLPLFSPHLPGIAAMAATGSDPVSFLINYGVAGIVILLLVTGQLRTKAEVTGLEKQLDQSRSDVKERDAAIASIMAQITQHTLPQMANLAEVLDRLPKQPDSGLAARLDQLTATLDAVDRRTANLKDGV